MAQQQPYLTQGLPSQQAQAQQSGFPFSADSMRPGAAATTHTQGMTAEQYNRIRQSLQTPNAGDNFSGVPSGVTAAAANNSLQADQQPPGLADALMPGGPLAFVAGGLGAWAGAEGLNRAYSGSQYGEKVANTFNRLNSVPGVSHVNQWIEKGLDAVQGKLTPGSMAADQVATLRKTQVPAEVEKRLLDDLTHSADRKFGPGSSAFHDHFGKFSSIQAMENALNATRKLELELGLRKPTLGDRLGKLFSGKKPKLADLVNIDPATNTISIKPGQQAALQDALDKHGIKLSGVTETSLDQATFRQQRMAGALHAANPDLSEKAVHRKMKGIRAYTKGQSQKMARYAEHFKLTAGLKGNPIGRLIANTGHHVKNAMGMLGGSSSGGAASRWFGPFLAGSMTLGFAVKEAKDAETTGDKVKAFARGLMVGFFGNLVGFEVGRNIFGQSGLIGKAFKGFAAKNFLGRFSAGGVVIELVGGLIMSILATTAAEKLMDGLFGKPKMKPGHEAPGAASPSQQPTTPGSAPASANPQPASNTPVSTISPDIIRGSQVAEHEARTQQSVISQIQAQTPGKTIEEQHLLLPQGV